MIVEDERCPVRPCGEEYIIVLQLISQLDESHYADTIYMWWGNVAAAWSAGRPSGLAISPGRGGGQST